MERLKKICKKKPAVYIPFEMVLLKKWVETKGGSFEHLHKFQVRINFHSSIFDIKINAFDYEFFILEQDKIQEVAKTLKEIIAWLNERLNKKTVDPRDAKLTAE